jgi:glycosyltransferase involved in cell wall biosynthesis
VYRRVSLHGTGFKCRRAPTPGMARVAVLHNTLDFWGGADAVCVHACAALAAAHDVTLFTVSRADPASVAAQFDVDLDVRVAAPPAADAVAEAFAAATPHVGPQLAARSVLLRAFFRRRAGDYDAAVSTANELSLPLPSVQYVHFPQFHLDRTAAADAGRLNAAWSRLAAPDPVGDTGAGASTREADAPARGDGGGGPAVQYLANSAWTAGVFEEIYGRRPAVCHPPVDPIDGQPWADRDDRVVVLGRIAPDKRTLDAIRVVDALRDRGHDVDCTVVGSAPAAYRDYVADVTAAASRRPYVTVETDASRARVEELLGGSRYGLNAKPGEHFGMAVAEYVAAGMLAFAPDDGGQVDVLGGDDRKLFDGPAEAADLLAAAIETGREPSLPRDRFGSGRFAAALRRRVDDALAAAA